jgi:hypothetical protein
MATSRPVRFIPEEGAHTLRSTRGSVGFSAGLDVEEKRKKNFFPLQQIESLFL